MQSIHYHQSGQGQPVVLLHSGGLNHEEWQPQIRHLSQKFHVLAPDLPGHGGSPLVSPYTIAQIATELVHWLDKLQLEKVHLVGSSLGGAVALWLARQHPNRLVSLVLYRVSYRKTQRSHHHTQQLANPDYWRQFGLERRMQRIHKPQGGDQAWQQVIGRVPALLHPDHSSHGYSLEQMATLTIPTLLIVGDRDPLAPLNELVDLYQTLPKAQLWVLPNADHVTATNTWRRDSMSLELARFFQAKASHGDQHQ